MAFAQDLARRWVEDYDLQDRTVLEIGCGKGEFLIEMVKAAAKTIGQKEAITKLLVQPKEGVPCSLFTYPTIKSTNA